MALYVLVKVYYRNSFSKRLLCIRNNVIVPRIRDTFKTDSENYIIILLFYIIILYVDLNRYRGATYGIRVYCILYDVYVSSAQCVIIYSKHFYNTSSSRHCVFTTRSSKIAVLWS